MTRDERQTIGIQKWINNKCRGTLEWCTGTGKTRAAIKGIKSFLSTNKNKKVVVIVPTEHLKVQWLIELNKFGLIQLVSVEIINSAVKLKSQIDLLVLDEVHRIASSTFYEVFTQRTPKLVLGLSATFKRLDGKEDLLKRFCPVVDVLPLKEALANNWLSEYREYKVSLEPEDYEIYRELNREFFNAFAYFNNDFSLAMNSITGIKKGKMIVKPAHLVRYEYAQFLCDLPKNHYRYKDSVAQLFKEVTAMAFTWNRALQARKEYVMNHPIKLEITRKILKARPNSKAITFSATKKLADKIGNGFVVHSGKTKKKNSLTIEEFSKLKTGTIHTAKSLDEGADIQGLNLAIILSNTSSQTQKTQRVGRVIRKEEGKIAEIFTLVLKGTVEENWFTNSMENKPYIEINLEELDEILNGGKSDNLVQEGQELGPLFRL